MATNPSTRAVELIHVLNTSDPAAVQAASTEFHAIRTHPHGWTVGVDLLQLQDANVRFYGALILQIKLNQQGKSLSLEDAGHVRASLVDALVQSTHVATPVFVRTKICSALATYFVHSPETWNHAIDSLTTRMRAITSQSALSDLPQAIPLLSPEQAAAILRFGTLLAEEVAKPHSSPQDDKRLEDCLKTNTDSVLSLLQHALSSKSVDDHSPAFDDAMACFAAWCCYGHKRWQYDATAAQSLTVMIDIAMRYLSHSALASRAALNAFATVLDQCSNFLSLQQTVSLWDHVSRNLPAKLCDPSDTTLVTPPNEEHLAVLKLIPVIAQSILPRLRDTPDDPNTQHICGILQRLPLMSGYPGDADDLLTPTCSFWIDFAEHVGYSDDFDYKKPNDKVEKSLNVLLGTIRFLCEIFRPAALAAFKDGTWSRDDNWSQAVQDILELMTETANLPGTQLSSYVLTQLLNAIPTRNWPNIDFYLSAAIAIADSGQPDENILQAVYKSPLLSMVTDSQIDMPVSTAKSIVLLVQYCQSHLSNHTATLLFTLERILLALRYFAINYPDVSDQAARCFNAMCSYSRTTLLSSLDPLSSACLDAVRSPNATLYQKEKVVAGLSCVIEALPTAREKIQPLNVLLQVVREEVEASSALLDAGQQEAGVQRGVSALQVLSAIGRGLQTRPGDSLIDLSDDESSARSTHTFKEDQESAQLWHSEQGQAVQNAILACLRHVNRLRDSGDAIQATCAVLRVGIAEETPNPFVFPPSTVSGFLQMMHLAMPRVEALLTTACAFTSAASRRKSNEGDTQAIATILRAVMNLILELPDISHDPQVAQIAIEFLDRVTLRHVRVLFSTVPESQLAAVFTFVLECLNGDAPMLKRAAASFLAAVLDQTGAKSTQTLSPDLKARIAAFMEQLAPHLASCLMNQIGGQAQRSEVDSCSKVLRAFIVTRSSARGFLEAALANLGTGVGVSDAEKRMWLQKVIMLRGGTRTNAVVKEFWAASKGTVTSF